MKGIVYISSHTILRIEDNNPTIQSKMNFKYIFIQMNWLLAREINLYLHCTERTTDALMGVAGLPGLPWRVGCLACTLHLIDK